VKLHDAPDARDDVQLPRLPLVGAVTGQAAPAAFADKGMRNNAGVAQSSAWVSSFGEYFRIITIPLFTFYEAIAMQRLRHEASKAPRR
jgi:hypothetical protein